MSWYQFLDYGFATFHSLLVLFVLFGWLWWRTRRAHLIVTGLILSSWFILGLKYGLGYCPSTDWHWQVKRQLGEKGLPNSCVKYYLDLITGKEFDSNHVDLTVALLGISLFLISFVVNWRDWYSGSE